MADKLWSVPYYCDAETSDLLHQTARVALTDVPIGWRFALARDLHNLRTG